MLAKNELQWSNWTDGKAERTNQMSAVFVLRLEIIASASDNGMKIQCASDVSYQPVAAIKNFGIIRNLFCKYTRVY